MTAPVRKTVFVVGAGASKEVRLPVGAELKDRIAQVLDIYFEHGLIARGDQLLVDALRVASSKNGSRDLNPLLYAGWAIRDAMPLATSIDAFVESRHGNKEIELCGKLAIVRTILEGEASSSLYVDDYRRTDARIDFKRLSDTWFGGLMNLITQRCPVDQVKERLSSLALIIFNYDRCVEHFLFNSLQIYFGIGAGEVASLLSNLEIHHPYGVVGQLPWASSGSGIRYGTLPSAHQIVALAGGIKTFSEGTDAASSDIETIRDRIRYARQLVFMGFAFHPMNLDLLFDAERAADSSFGRSTFATAFQMSESNIASISAELRARAPYASGPIQIRNMKCGELLQEFSRSIALVP